MGTVVWFPADSRKLMGPVTCGAGSRAPRAASTFLADGMSRVHGYQGRVGQLRVDILSGAIY